MRLTQLFQYLSQELQLVLKFPSKYGQLSVHLSVKSESER